MLYNVCMRLFRGMKAKIPTVGIFAVLENVCIGDLPNGGRRFHHECSGLRIVFLQQTGPSVVLSAACFASTVPHTRIFAISYNSSSVRVSLRATCDGSLQIHESGVVLYIRAKKQIPIPTVGIGIL